MEAGRSNWADPRDSWGPVIGLFGVGLVLVLDLALPGGIIDGGIWIPLLYAVVPVAVGVLAYVRTRSVSGRSVSPLVLAGITIWGLVGAIVALIALVVVGLGRPSRVGPPPALFGLVTGLVTYLVPAGVYAAFYAEAGRRSRALGGALVVAAPIVDAIVLAALALATY